MLIIFYQLSLSVLLIKPVEESRTELYIKINVLNILFHALIACRIVYALPAFSGFLSEYNRSRINTAFRPCY